MKWFLIAICFLIPLKPLVSTGNVFPTSGTNDAGIGATAWVNPGNIVSDNTTDATCTAAASSQYLVGKTYSFTIPQNAQITGITVRIEASESSTGAETLNGRLQDAGGALFGSTKTASINGTGKTVYTYGSATDTWTLTQTTITPDIVNDPDFGVRFWYTTAHTMAVDYVTIAIEYALGGGFFQALSTIKVKIKTTI
ncbi:exported hypothetical protein [Gammaproteobacteria bacterium]